MSTTEESFDALVKDLRKYADPEALGLSDSDLAPRRKYRKRTIKLEKNGDVFGQNRAQDHSEDQTWRRYEGCEPDDDILTQKTVPLFVSRSSGKRILEEDERSEGGDRFFFDHGTRKNNSKSGLDRSLQVKKIRDASWPKYSRLLELQYQHQPRDVYYAIQMQQGSTTNSTLPQPNPDLKAEGQPTTTFSQQGIASIEPTKKPRKRGRKLKKVPEADAQTIELNADHNAVQKARLALNRLATHKSDKVAKKVQRLQRRSRRRLNALGFLPSERNAGKETPTVRLFARTPHENKTASSQGAIALVPMLPKFRDLDGKNDPNINVMSSFRALREQDLFAYNIEDRFLQASQSTSSPSKNHEDEDNSSDDFSKSTFFQDASLAPGRHRRRYLLADRK